MEVKLQEFVRQIETLSNVRNSAPMNPVAVDLDFPGMSMRFRVVGSISEPTYQAYPINLIWVVMDANSLYYRKTLQLKSHIANDPTVAGAISGNYLGTWVEVTTYENLFLYPQYYALDTGAGEQGPPGPKGEPGYNLQGIWQLGQEYKLWDTVFFNGSSYYSTLASNTGNTPGQGAAWSLVALKGDTPVVDNEAIIQEVINRLNLNPVRLEIRGLPAIMYSNQTAPFKVFAIYANGSEAELPVADYHIEYDLTLGQIDHYNRTLTTNALEPQGEMPLKAVFEADPNVFGEYVQQTRRTAPVSLVISGPNSVVENTSARYTAVCTFNDGSSLTVPSQNTVWSVNPSSAGSIVNNNVTTHGTFTAAEVSANTPAVIGCSYTYGNQSPITATKSITVTNVVVAQKARYGSGPRVASGFDTTYNQNFLETITNREMATSGFDNQFNLDLPNGSNLFGWYAHPKSWGIARFEDLDAPGFYGGWDGARNNILNPELWGPFEVQATFNGVTEPWLLYRTDHHSLGLTRWSMTKLPGS